MNLAPAGLEGIMKEGMVANQKGITDGNERPTKAGRMSNIERVVSLESKARTDQEVDRWVFLK